MSFMNILIIEEIHRNWVKNSNVQNMLVTESEICELINRLSAGKASVYDGIDTKYIKFGGPMMVTVITKIFNRAITTVIFPEVFKFGLLIPIPNSGRTDYIDNNNSHGITLLTTIRKLYEKVFKMRLIEDSMIKV